MSQEIPNLESTHVNPGLKAQEPDLLSLSLSSTPADKGDLGHDKDFTLKDEVDADQNQELNPEKIHETNDDKIASQSDEQFTPGYAPKSNSEPDQTFDNQQHADHLTLKKPILEPEYNGTTDNAAGISPSSSYSKLPSLVNSNSLEDLNKKSSFIDPNTKEVFKMLEVPANLDVPYSTKEDSRFQDTDFSRSRLDKEESKEAPLAQHIKNQTQLNDFSQEKTRIDSEVPQVDRQIERNGIFSRSYRVMTILLFLFAFGISSYFPLLKQKWSEFSQETAPELRIRPIFKEFANETINLAVKLGNADIPASATILDLRSSFHTLRDTIKTHQALQYQESLKSYLDLSGDKVFSAGDKLAGLQVKANAFFTSLSQNLQKLKDLVPIEEALKCGENTEALSLVLKDSITEFSMLEKALGETLKTLDASLQQYVQDRREWDSEYTDSPHFMDTVKTYIQQLHAITKNMNLANRLIYVDEIKGRMNKLHRAKADLETIAIQLEKIRKNTISSRDGLKYMCGYFIGSEEDTEILSQAKKAVDRESLRFGEKETKKEESRIIGLAKILRKLKAIIHTPNAFNVLPKLVTIKKKHGLDDLFSLLLEGKITMVCNIDVTKKRGALGKRCWAIQNEDSSLRDNLRYRTFEGRRYHNIPNSQYYVPNDDIESIRLNKSNFFIKHFFKGNFGSPIEELLTTGRQVNVLDVGCGTGNWILEMAKLYPHVKFFGIDMSPIFPRERLPENVQFLECNILDGLPFEDDIFDFVHQRLLSAAFTQNQWENVVINELLRLAKPGGWVELLEPDGEIKTEGEVTRRVINAGSRLLSSKGIDYRIVNKLEEIMKKTSKFQQIIHQEVEIPLGNRGDVWGKVALEFVMEGTRGVRVFLATFMNITLEHLDALLETMEREADEMNTHYIFHRFFKTLKILPVGRETMVQNYVIDRTATTKMPKT
ncbi:hypothetical protein G9A89_012568 [Geosiphon pyriformis]|nr:hypothetical protein G9A89_012568 [Geosiphon pyriformis]